MPLELKSLCRSPRLWAFSTINILQYCRVEQNSWQTSLFCWIVDFFFLFTVTTFIFSFYQNHKKVTKLSFNCSFQESTSDIGNLWIIVDFVLADQFVIQSLSVFHSFNMFKMINKNLWWLAWLVFGQIL